MPLFTFENNHRHNVKFSIKYFGNKGRLFFLKRILKGLIAPGKSSEKLFANPRNAAAAVYDS